ncbi:uracil-DNA glycosylase [Vibrio sp. ZSDZ34]|uniref:Uracil-DNA glycosylase n=1 Tax=Vibrio gelatinilyticus TaxID=2893468 RepID=A0A9X2AXQ1_9VIBR|nr:uracil-DNA glycosylase [Vibrio gelatinilyticus]MCJ2375883.1 uracil-DNA glycosylase [Vibrio gelatinilyticus]
MNASLTWDVVLKVEEEKEYYQALIARIEQQRQSGTVVFPPKEDVFSAFALTPFSDIKVVILGQDPYHGAGQAHGLCFSVRPSVKIPPSLVNIYKELAQDIPHFQIPHHGNLDSWAKQGVLLLNTVLTVEQGKAHSHAKYGWETFTEQVIKVINEHCNGVIFLLWGAHAQKKGKAIDRERHHILTAPHPSPLSAHRGFLGCRHFSQTNQLLKQSGRPEIDWQPPLSE